MAMRKTLKPVVLFFTLMFVLTPAYLYAEVLLHVDFDNHPVGPYTGAMARADFPYQGFTWYSNTLDSGRAEIVPGENGQGRALRLLYPAGQIGSASTAQIRAALKKAVDTAWVSYRVMFEDGFDFVRGGKLPGLCGGRCITGGNSADGYNGWSARVMWRGEGVGEQYMYYGGHNGFHSVLFNKVPPVKRFVPGKWHRINTQIIMNTPGIPNGIVRTWIDGELSLERDDFLFRHIDTLKIDLFYISTFFGGSDPSWAPSRDTYITYDDFLVISQPESSPYPQTLYTLSAESGRMSQGQFTVYADLSASLGSNLSAEVHTESDGIRSGANISPDILLPIRYYVPGIFDIYFRVYNDTLPPTSLPSLSRKVFVLDEFDLLCDSLWQGRQFGDTLRTGDTLRFFLTILDPKATVSVGPTITDEPVGEHSFFGVLRHENETFSAINGNNYVDAVSPISGGIGTYEVKFTFNFTVSNAMTYSVWVNGALVGENLGRRGHATSILAYGTRATRDRAAVVHMKSWDYNTSINNPQSQRATVKRTPTAKPARNGISFAIPAAAAQIEIFNAKGALIKRLSTADNRTGATFVPVAAKGLYVYRITAGGHVYRGSVVVR